jgi:predicted DNA binding CopG/RHH family protein
MPKRRAYRELPDVELSPELDAKVRAMTAQADREIEETRVNFRWGKGQVAAVKRAAALLGVPYQTYIKQVVITQAVRDIRDAEPILNPT